MNTTIILERGSVISNKASNGTEVVVVDDDVVKDGTVVIAKGTHVKVSINKKKAKGVGKAGSVELRCISTTSVDGQTIALEGMKAEEGDSRQGLALGLGIGLGVFTLIGFACLAIKGEKANIETNTIIPNIMVMDDYLIEN